MSTLGMIAMCLPFAAAAGLVIFMSQGKGKTPPTAEEAEILKLQLQEQEEEAANAEKA